DLGGGRVPTAPLAAQQGGVGGILNKAVPKQVKQLGLEGRHPHQASALQLGELRLNTHRSLPLEIGAAGSLARAEACASRPARRSSPRANPRPASARASSMGENVLKSACAGCARVSANRASAASSSPASRWTLASMASNPVSTGEGWSPTINRTASSSALARA